MAKAIDFTRHATHFDLGSMPWKDRLAFVVETMREISHQTDPQRLVQAYGKRIQKLIPSDRYISLSRRDLPPRQYRITRTNLWEKAVDPWREGSKLPVLEGGVLGDLLYGDEPVLMDELTATPTDPAYPFIAGMRSLVAIPLYDQGKALNMVVLLREQTRAFRSDQLPEHVWISNLFGRATQSLVLAQKLEEAGAIISRELQAVANLQRSLLPQSLPAIPGVDIGVFYRTSSQAGGDYYDILPMPDGRWGILIADVSGHGTPAAVLMAVTHSIVHTHPDIPWPPSRLLNFLNKHLAARYTSGNGTFVTALFGVYDPATRELTYSNAGHCPPRWRLSDGAVRAIDQAGQLPLGIESGTGYVDHNMTIGSGETVLFYTDGVTDAAQFGGDWFGLSRLDAALAQCGESAQATVDCVIGAVDRFATDDTGRDDQTILAMKAT